MERHGPASADHPHPISFEQEEREQIDLENRSRLAEMTDEDIERERQELLRKLDPRVIKSLLSRASIDAEPIDPGTRRDNAPVEGARPPPESAKEALPITPEPQSNTTEISNTTITQGHTALPSDSDVGKVHFPRPPEPPELDPSDPAFLENLHQKYFPSLPADPSKVAWMAPLPMENSVADRNSPYSPHQSGVPASALRFDFKANILPPRTARSVPVTAGLHHHGDAPEAAGYTVPELAHLARLSFPAQRCVAFQTLGRILYRLGERTLWE